MLIEERLDRQLRIPGWDQMKLAKSRIAVVGDNDLLTSFFVMSASALGINSILVIAPSLDSRLLEVTKKINPHLKLDFLEGFFTHPAIDDIFSGCRVIVDLSRYGLANKLLIEKGSRQGIPVVRGFTYEESGTQGFMLFTYMRGREWADLERLISPMSMPGDHFDDAVLDVILSGIALDETKNLLMGRLVSSEIIQYSRPTLDGMQSDKRICVAGAGALGNFVGLSLAFSGFRNLTFMDPDIVETVNLNRQVLFHDSTGLQKATMLARKLNAWFGARANSVDTYFRRDTETEEYDAIFDCVDNFETRIVISEKAREAELVLVSGGTSATAGQAVVYDPTTGGPTPAELLGLYEIMGQREIEEFRRVRESCIYRPDASVIMTNQIIAGFMVDSYRMLLSGLTPRNIFYDSTSETKF